MLINLLTLTSNFNANLYKFRRYLLSTVQSVSLSANTATKYALSLSYSTSSPFWSSSGERICRIRPLWAIPKLIHNSKLSPVNGLFICHFHNSICTAPNRIEPCFVGVFVLICPEAGDNEIQHPKFIAAAVFKFIARVFVLLIMKNLSHLNQYDPDIEPVLSRVNLFKNCHRAMIDYWMTRAKT